MNTALRNFTVCTLLTLLALAGCGGNATNETKAGGPPTAVDCNKSTS